MKTVALWLMFTLSALAAPGFLGIGVEEQEANLLITRVFPDSPAEQAGIEVDDLLIAWNGEALKTVDDFSARASQLEVGTPLRLTVLHAGSQADHELKAAEVPALPELTQRAETLITQSNYKDAAAYFDYALSRYQNDLDEAGLAQLLDRFGYALLGADIPFWAAYRFSQAIALDSENPKPRYGRAIAFYSIGDFARGEFDWKEVGNRILYTWPGRPELHPDYLRPRAALSSRLQEKLAPLQERWLDERGAGVWAVMRYHVDSQGQLTQVETLFRSAPEVETTGLLEGLVIEPAEGVSGVEVTELFGRPVEGQPIPFDQGLLKRRALKF